MGFNVGDPENWKRLWLQEQRREAKALRADADYLEHAADKGIIIEREATPTAAEELQKCIAELDRERGRKVHLASRNGGLIHSEFVSATNARRDALIREAVRNRDRVKPGERKPTLKEIGKQFRLSASAVSRIARR